ncbi:hypothetical protein [Cronobacter dublinensis]|uniref:hypothetical protein n=1 Tax=Cronobacter dublinensis TaxID=413497 RepID=UPI000CFFBE01|nr:hypothetical protein [Cronobacter dublinensis]
MENDGGIEEIRRVENDYFDSKRKEKIGLYFMIFGSFMIVTSFIGWPLDTKFMQGFIFGVSLLFWLFMREQTAKHKALLDRICMQRYGKGYLSSVNQIYSERAESSWKPFI